MPYTICPLCGSYSQLSVADHKRWYEERGVPFGALVPAQCYFCWKEIGVGDSVVVRKQVISREDVQPGNCGTVKAVQTSADGSLFEVQMQNSKVYVFIRAEIRHLIGNELETKSDEVQSDGRSR